MCDQCSDLTHAVASLIECARPPGDPAWAKAICDEFGSASLMIQLMMTARYLADLVANHLADEHVIARAHREVMAGLPSEPREIKRISHDDLVRIVEIATIGRPG